MNSQRSFIFAAVLGLGALMAGCTIPIISPLITPTVIGGTGKSNVEKAHAQFTEQGNVTVLVILSADSSGVEGDIYRDLRKRNIRMTTGPDEGFDVSGLACHPYCIFAPKEEIDAISVASWLRVFKHEYRHVTQAQNNPTMASDFRAADGRFTTYAAFAEACADYGINVGPGYYAQRRIDQLKRTLGEDEQPLIDTACTGNKLAYQALLDRYNRLQDSDTAFAKLFPPYR